MKLRFFAHLRMLYCAVLVLCATTTLFRRQSNSRTLSALIKPTGKTRSKRRWCKASTETSTGPRNSEAQMAREPSSRSAPRGH